MDDDKLVISSELLLEAYARGLFPMSPDRESSELQWYFPEERGILPLQGMIVSRKLMKTVRSGKMDVTSDVAFEEVMERCAEAAPGRETTWISGEICRLYSELHHKGHAHSVEVWEDGVLVGGLYGVSLGGAFFGESMFSRRRDASKVALVHLVAGMRQGGYVLLDTQYTTSHLLSLGGVGVSSDQYLLMLNQALTISAVWPKNFGFHALENDIASLRPHSGDF
ncbi:leucyl/phenylalanyl-tRNA--protein transferase [Swingsia samuiensis]|uniref:Leucyl/phenylalanyl-tRNA--protein transferase n=1 Tax=Swingsia samuiensis TaxID=1293412 RepID=A0A4Y6ULQ8_9PROT|nr:leucyl/phenylalanyl-tRNA--protein transferase [Swingsia samuiensis]QDH17267.1 leucyl/phenylalanyl-tRNA--protein transferase [Swingsia samuiensis]